MAGLITILNSWYDNKSGIKSSIPSSVVIQKPGKFAKTLRVR